MLSMQTSGEQLWPKIINSSETFVDLSLVCGTILCGKVTQTTPAGIPCCFPFQSLIQG